jgi:hypothetical protein
VLFTVTELELLIEALEKTASRHESEARYNPRNARPHDDKAVAMRELRNRLLRHKNDARLKESNVIDTLGTPRKDRTQPAAVRTLHP